MQLARFAHMCHFLSVCLSSVWTGPKVLDNNIQIKIAMSKDKLRILICTFVLVTETVTDYMLRKINVIIAVTGRAHCQLQVAFFNRLEELYPHLND